MQWHHLFKSDIGSTEVWSSSRSWFSSRVRLRFDFQVKNSNQISLHLTCCKLQVLTGELLSSAFCFATKMRENYLVTVFGFMYVICNWFFLYYISTWIQISYLEGHLISKPMTQCKLGRFVLIYLKQEQDWWRSYCGEYMLLVVIRIRFQLWETGFSNVIDIYSVFRLMMSKWTNPDYNCSRHASHRF